MVNISVFWINVQSITVRVLYNQRKPGALHLVVLYIINPVWTNFFMWVSLLFFSPPFQPSPSFVAPWICSDLALDNLVATNVLEEDQRIIAREALLTRHRHHKQKKKKEPENKAYNKGRRKSSMFPGMDRAMSDIGRSQSTGNNTVSMEQGTLIGFFAVTMRSKTVTFWS